MPCVISRHSRESRNEAKKQQLPSDWLQVSVEVTMPWWDCGVRHVFPPPWLSYISLTPDDAFIPCSLET